MCIFKKRNFDEQQIKDTIADLIAKCRCLEQKIDKLTLEVNSMKEYEKRVSYDMNHVAEELVRLAKFHEHK